LGEHHFLFSLEKRFGGRDRQQRGGGYYRATIGKRTTSEGKTRLVLVFIFSFRFLYPMSRGGGGGERIGTAAIEKRSTRWHRKRADLALHPGASRGRHGFLLVVCWEREAIVESTWHRLLFFPPSWPRLDGKIPSYSPVFFLLFFSYPPIRKLRLCSVCA
jgi:hypothetical protein